MAQYNLVGYNAAPRNIAYEEMQSGLDKTPRTNWAEYSLKKDQLKEQKKQNRIQNIMNMVNTAATAVNTYENVLNSELQRDSQKLVNQERALTIQSKQIDVNKKIDQTNKDLTFVNKLRELQKTGDYQAMGALLLSDPETAARNKIESQAVIEQMRFHKIGNADELFKTIFPEDAYKREQDTLNRETQIKLEGMRQAGATQRTLMQIEANKPLRDAQIANYTALTNKTNAEYESISGTGRTIAEQKRLATEYRKADDDLQNQITMDPILGELNNGDTKITASELVAGNIKTVNLDNVESLARVQSNIQATLNGGVSNTGALSRLLAEGGDTTEGLTEWAANNPKLRLLEKVNDDGTSSYYIVNAKMVEAIGKATRTGARLYEQNIMEHIDHVNGKLSELTPLQLEALSNQSPSTLRSLDNRWDNKLLQSATPKQRETPAYIRLAGRLDQSIQQIPTQTTQQNQPQTTTLPDIIDNTIKTNPNLTKSELSQKILPSLTSNQLNAFAKQGAQLAGKNVSVDTMSDTMKKNYAAIALEADLGDQLQGLTSKKVQTVTTNAETFTDELDSLIARYMTSESTDSNIAAQIDKWHRTNVSDLKSSDYIKREDRRNAENTAYEKEIHTVADKLGSILDEYDIEVSGGKRWGRTTYTLDGTTAVNNLVNTTLRMIKEEEAGKRRVGTTPISNRKALLEYLAGTLDRAIDKAREQSDRR